MGVFTVVATAIYYALLLYFFAMWGRFIIDLVRSFNRSWRPTGFMLVLVEFVYSITDPPVLFFRRVIPPLRLGTIAFDFGWSVAMLLVIVAMTATSWMIAASR